MSSMRTPQMAVQTFAVVRRGFDREQVNSTLARLEAEAEILRADRDSAVERAERAAADLERERDRVRELEKRVAELGRVPATSEQMSDRLSTMLGLATAEAESIRDNAHSTADRILTEADETAWRLRETARTELSDIRARNNAVRTEHDAVLKSARDRGQEIVRAAERDARQLAEDAARQRNQIDEDHRLASDLRRSEALREYESSRSAAAATAAAVTAKARDEGEAAVSEAHDRAKKMIDEAIAHTRELQVLRRGVLSDLAAIRARLEPIPSGLDQDESLPDQPMLNSNDE